MDVPPIGLSCSHCYHEQGRPQKSNAFYRAITKYRRKGEEFLQKHKPTNWQFGQLAHSSIESMIFRDSYFHAKVNGVEIQQATINYNVTVERFTSHDLPRQHLLSTLMGFYAP